MGPSCSPSHCQPAGRCERRPGRDHRAHAQPAVPGEGHAALGAGRGVRRAHAQHGGSRPGRHLPQRVGAAVRGAAVVEHGRATVQQAADQEVPGHPARRAVQQERVVRPQVQAQAEGLQVLEHAASVAVDDPLGEPRRPRGEQHPQRSGELDLLEHRLARIGDQPVEGDGVQRAGHRILRSQRPDEDDAAHRRHRLAQLRHDVAPVVLLPGPPVAVHGDDHRRFDLAQAVQNAARTEVRRARRPHRTEARRGQQRDHRLRDVGQVRRDAVPGTDTQVPEGGRERIHLPTQLRGGDPARRPLLGDGDQRGPVPRRPREHGLGVVQPRPLEPTRSRHGPGVEHRGARGGRADVEEAPHRAPEVLQLLHRPAPQAVVVVEGQVLFPLQPAQELPHRAAGDISGRRLPRDRRSRRGRSRRGRRPAGEVTGRGSRHCPGAGTGSSIRSQLWWLNTVLLPPAS